MGDTRTKRRKWDVAAPHGIPLANTRAGIGNVGVTGINHPAYGGPALDHLPSGTSLYAGSNEHTGQLPPVVSFAPAPAATSVVHLPKIDVSDIKGKPLDEDTIRRIQQSAADVVAKLNQDLILKGIIPPGSLQAAKQVEHQPLQQVPAPQREDRTQILREVSINSAPPKTRFHLTKRSTMAEIEHRWSVLVVVRGRYYPPGTPETDQQDEKPLCLRITPGSQLPPDPVVRERHCSFAAADITAILNNTTRPDPAKLLHPTAPPSGMVYPSGAPLHQGPYPSGTAASSGALSSGAPPPGVALPGALSYPPPPGSMSYPPPSGTAYPPPGQYAPPPRQYAQPPQGQCAQPSGGAYVLHTHQPLQQPPAAPAAAASATAPAASPFPTRGPGYFCLYLGFEAPSEFNTAARIQGPNNGYLQHIENSTQVSVVLAGRGSGASPEGPEPLHVRVSSQEPHALLEAVKLTGNLIDTIREDYKKAYPNNTFPPPPGNYDPPAPAAPATMPIYQQQPPWGHPPGPVGTPGHEAFTSTQQYGSGQQIQGPSVPSGYFQQGAYGMSYGQGIQKEMQQRQPPLQPPQQQAYSHGIYGGYLPPVPQQAQEYPPPPAGDQGYSQPLPSYGASGGYDAPAAAYGGQGYGGYQPPPQQGYNQQPQQQPQDVRPAMTLPDAPHPPKRRFQEIKPEELQQASPKMPPYAAQYQQHYVQQGPALHPSLPQKEFPRGATPSGMGAMGPPSPRAPGGMMGPPPPRPPNQGMQGMVLPGMEAYTD